ncbi:hypothetical protein [Halostagnicola sp. A-GB9-2]|uniref:hypothetical protein n=1 Tax=Halostagnicola sp. A-GB9-2 TaxID=3048066 RepID=UPI0024C0B88E|nr:hypothetical protein [Halostagnicola sp. A-GB9-2]MDJ1432332.1 hypothetical protein [Halostagnicola sp. A-GB9-2]
MDDILLGILGFQISIVAGIDLLLREIGPTPEGAGYILIWVGVLITIVAVGLNYVSSD